VIADIGLLPCVHQAHSATNVGSWLTATLIIGGGTVAGGIAGWFACRFRHPVKSQPDQLPSIDAVDEQQIGQVAADWAASHGRTQDQDLVAQKLRLFRQLQQRRITRRGWIR
jgi:hypothetical protein